MEKVQDAIVEDAYQQEKFAEYYDVMVDALPEGFEVGVDCEAAAMRATAMAVQDRPLRILDLCTGTGRVALGLLQRLRETVQLQVVGVDSSRAMLLRAETKRDECGFADGGVLQLLEGRMQSLLQVVPRNGRAFDMILLFAGSFHHLLSTEEQVSTLRSLRSLLSTAEARVFVDLFGEDEFEPLETWGGVGSTGGCAPNRGYLHQHIQRRLERAGEASDSVIIAHDVFELSKFHSDEPTEMLWTVQQGWSLRQVRKAHFRQLVASCELRVVDEYASYADVLKGRPSAQTSREQDKRAIFELALLAAGRSHDV